MDFTLREQYQQPGGITRQPGPDPDFSITNLRTLNWPLPFRVPVRRHNFFALNFVKQARGWYLIDGQQFELQPGTIYLATPTQLRAFEYQELEEVHVITLSEGFLKENVHPEVFEEFPFLLTGLLPAATVSPALFAEFEQLYQQLSYEYRASSPFRQRLLGNLLVVLLFKLKEHLWLGRAEEEAALRGPDIVQHFHQALEQHYRELVPGAADATFPLHAYAAAQGLHSAYLAQVVKSRTGKPVSAWLAEKTIVEAKARLCHTALAIKEIAYLLGFVEPAHFTNFFKKHTHLTPQQFRRQSKGSA